VDEIPPGSIVPKSPADKNRSMQKGFSRKTPIWL